MIEHYLYALILQNFVISLPKATLYEVAFGVRSQSVPMNTQQLASLLDGVPATRIYFWFCCNHNHSSTITFLSLHFL